MVIRLIGTIAALVVMAFFVGFNLENRCNVSLIFRTFENVPVLITILISCAAGMFLTLPVTLSRRFKKQKNAADIRISKKEKKLKRLAEKQKNKEEPLEKSAVIEQKTEPAQEKAAEIEPESETGSAI